MNKILYVLLAGLFVFAACTAQTPTDNNQTPPQNNQTGLTADTSFSNPLHFCLQTLLVKGPRRWTRGATRDTSVAAKGNTDERDRGQDGAHHRRQQRDRRGRSGPDRSDEVVAQVLTDHTIRVVVRNSEIESAIIDDRWNERTQEAMTGEPAQEPGIPTESQETVTLSFQPMQCEDQPWDEWYQEGNVNYVTEPTDEQLIQDYYANAHGIPVQQVEKIQSDQIVCQACNTCPTGYSYELTVQEGFVGGGLEEDVFSQHGWE